MPADISMSAGFFVDRLWVANARK